MRKTKIDDLTVTCLQYGSILVGVQTDSAAGRFAFRVLGWRRVRRVVVNVMVCTCR